MLFNLDVLHQSAFSPGAFEFNGNPSFAGAVKAFANTKARSIGDDRDLRTTKLRRGDCGSKPSYHQLRRVAVGSLEEVERRSTTLQSIQ
jgi:hypothetical protein